VVRNLPKVKPRTPLLGVNSTDTPLQGASSSSIPTEGEGLGQLTSGIGEICLAKKALSGCTRWRLKNVRASEAGTGGIQQPENVGAPKQEETLTETRKTPRSEGSNHTEMARPSKKAQGL
jgi:hypothetical protein